MRFRGIYTRKAFLYTSIFILGMLFSFLLVLSTHINSLAKVTGECINCHTMHNSQDGIDVDPNGPNETLLRVSDCLGCHSAADSSTGIDPTTNAPIVLNTASGGPSYGISYGGINQGLAGGNFYWVWTEDDNKGHNVFFDNPDSLTTAPGSSAAGAGCGTNSCHNNLHANTGTLGTGNDGLDNRQGCTKCHMVDDDDGPIGFHHADDSGTVVDSFPWYRFLKGHMSADQNPPAGVKGIESSDWQLDPSSTNHNEYLGLYPAQGNIQKVFSLKNNTMTAFCCACHGDFHEEESSGVWIRHPSDAVIPNSGEYASAFGASGGVGTYDPNVPIARDQSSDVWTTGISDAVNIGEDMVMCLSCHRAHGSPYPDMLRWNYEDMIAGGGGLGGCFVCHTEKNQII